MMRATDTANRAVVRRTLAGPLCVDAMQPTMFRPMRRLGRRRYAAAYAANRLGGTAQVAC